MPSTGTSTPRASSSSGYKPASAGRELDEEVRAHLELRAEELEARGLSPEEARREAAVSAVLAAVGIFGVLAGVVAEREREIGVRTALGASRGEIVRMIVLQGLRLSAAGAGLGLVVSIGCSRFLESLLFGVGPLDPATYAGVTALLVTVALTASWAPARRAARLDPAGALRGE